MNTRTTKPRKIDNTKTPAKKTKLASRESSPQLLTPEQFEAITKATYQNPDARLVLELFLHVNYSWQIAKRIYTHPDTVAAYHWRIIEKNAAQLITKAASRLLGGIDPSSWLPAEFQPESKHPEQSPPPPEKKSRAKAPRKPKAKKQLACGHYVHSNAAGVVEACMQGQEEGSDCSWY